MSVPAVKNRPKCACCGKPLQPHWIVDHQYENAPSQRPVVNGKYFFNPNHSAPVLAEKLTQYGPAYWLGGYEGYDRSFTADRSHKTIFCTMRCAFDFAVAAHQGGYRIKESP